MSFKRLLHRMWFALYPRSRRTKGSCAFEHVFLGEVKNGKVNGFHNWLFFLLEEQKGMFFFKLMPCPFSGPKMFYAGPNFLSQPKNLFKYCASHKNFVLDTKLFAVTNVFEEALNAVNFLGWLKKFGPAQNIL